jgi:hypothetical protein
MIKLQDAVKIGKETISEIYEKPEEVILDSADKLENNWLVKFRVPINIKPINSLQNILGIQKRIFYKIVKIDENGDVIGLIDAELPKTQPIEVETKSV